MSLDSTALKVFCATAAIFVLMLLASCERAEPPNPEPAPPTSSTPPPSSVPESGQGTAGGAAPPSGEGAGAGSEPPSGVGQSEGPTSNEYGAVQPVPQSHPGEEQAAARLERLETVDSAIAAMESANIAFNAPDSLNLENTAQIQLLLSMEKSIEELREAVTAEGEKEGYEVRVSNQMEARLTGPQFQITAITNEEQALTSTGVTEWKWEVKPTAVGPHYLHLTLTAHFDVNGVATHRVIRVFDKKIEVDVTWHQRVSIFFSKNWQWLWAALLVPLVTWFWKKRKPGNNRQQR